MKTEKIILSAKMKPIFERALKKATSHPYNVHNDSVFVGETKGNTFEVEFHPTEISFLFNVFRFYGEEYLKFSSMTEKANTTNSIQIGDLVIHGNVFAAEEETGTPKDFEPEAVDAFIDGKFVDITEGINKLCMERLIDWADIGDLVKQTHEFQFEM